MSKVFNSTNHSLEIPDIVRSEGLYVYDGNGKRYMDLESGVWCTSLGHGNSRINEVIRRQLDFNKIGRASCRERV